MILNILIIILLIIIAYLVFRSTIAIRGGSRPQDFPSLQRYEPHESDHQFLSIMRKGQLDDQTRLIELIGRFTHTDYKSTTDLINRNLMSDKALYQKLRPTIDDVSRSRKHANRIYQYVQKYLPAEPSVIVDIGCGSGHITSGLKSLMGAKEAHCIEVNTPVQPPQDVKFHIINEPYPFADNSVDVVIALMSMHHIPNMPIKEIHRILKPKGVLVLKEHDCWSSGDRMLIDIEHMVHITHKGLDPKDYYCKALSIPEWHTLLTGFGFDRLMLEWYSRGQKVVISPTRAFIAVYRK